MIANRQRLAVGLDTGDRAKRRRDRREGAGRHSSSARSRPARGCERARQQEVRSGGALSPIRRQGSETAGSLFTESTEMVLTTGCWHYRLARAVARPTRAGVRSPHGSLVSGVTARIGSVRPSRSSRAGSACSAEKHGAGDDAPTAPAARPAHCRGDRRLFAQLVEPSRGRPVTAASRRHGRARDRLPAATRPDGVGSSANANY